MSEKSDQFNICRECGTPNTPTALLCQNCGAPLPRVKDKAAAFGQESNTNGENLQDFAQEAVTGGKEVKLSRFAQAARKKKESLPQEEVSDELPDWLAKLRADIPDPTKFPKVENEFNVMDEEEFEGAEEAETYISEERYDALLNPPVAETNVEPPTRDRKPGSGQLPNWLRELSNDTDPSQFAAGAEPPTGDTPLPEENGLQPFEVELSEGIKETTMNRIRATGDLSGGGVPDWLRDLTNPAETEDRKASNPNVNILKGQPVFEPPTAQDDTLPDWLSDDESGTGPDKPGTGELRDRNLPNWLRQSRGTKPAPNTGPSTFGDFELEKALEEAFNEPTPAPEAPIPLELEGLAPFEVEELPSIGLEPYKQLGSLNGEAMEKQEVPELPPLDILFTEIDEPITSSGMAASQVDFEVAEPDNPEEMDLLGVESRPLKVTGFLPEIHLNIGLTPAEFQEPQEGKAPWGSGLAPWLQGLDLPGYSTPTKESDDEELVPFSLNEMPEPITTPPELKDTGSSRSFSMADLMQPEQVALPSDNLPEEEASAAQAFLPQDVPGPTDSTRPISLRDLMKQTVDLTKSMAEMTPEVTAPEIKIPSLPQFLDDEEEAAEPPELQPFTTSGPGDQVTESDEGIIGDVNTSNLPVWMMRDHDLPGTSTLIEPVDQVPLPETAEQIEQPALETEANEPIPAWLEEASGTTWAESEAAQEEIPEWLGGDTAEEEPQPPAEIPDWLGEVPEAPTGEAKMAAEEAVKEEVPEWLGITEENVAPPEDEPQVPEWLADEAGTAAAEVEIPAPDELTPDWLGELDAIAPAQPEEQIPDWLAAEAELQPDVPSFSMEDEEGESEEELKAFDLAEFAATEPVNTPPPLTLKDALDAARSQVPDWLGSPEPDEQPAEDEEEEPEWLKAMAEGKLPGRTAEEAPRTYSQVGSAALEEQLENIPEWLREESAATEAPATPEVVETEPANPPDQGGGDSQVGRLLREIAMLGDDAPAPAAFPDWLQPEKKEEEMPDIVATDIPDWLKDDNTGTNPIQGTGATGEITPERPLTQEPVQPAQPATFANTDFFSDMDAPSWLRGATKPLQPEAFEQALQPEAPPLAVADMTPGQLPTWLRTVGPKVAEEVVPFDEVDTSHGKIIPFAILPPTLASADVLAALLEPPVTKPKAKPVTKRGLVLDRPTVIRYIGYLAILLAVLIGVLAAPANLSVPVQPQTSNFFGVVDSLKANQKVLVAFDWEASVSGEMKPLALAINQHIMSKRARLVAISLNPQGPANASQILNDLATMPEYGNSAAGFYDYGKGYLNLGYRPGNELAVRGMYNNLDSLEDYRFNRPASNFQAMSGIKGLADFDLIVILAGDEGNVRTWIEQAGIQPDGPRLLLATTSAVAPFAQPYYAQGISSARAGIAGRLPRAQGLVAGLSGVTEYSQLLRDRGLITDRNLNLSERLNAQNLAILALVLIILVTNVYLVVELIRKRRSAD